MTGLESIRKLWLAERSSFEAFSAIVGERLNEALRTAGIPRNVTWRAKEVDSLLKKLMRKAHHTYESLPDKAGVRVVVRFQRQVPEVIELARTLFWCGRAERTEERLAPDQVGYHSTHVDVALRPDDSQHPLYPGAKYHAELQVRTLAQHFWSEMAHDTIYKGGEAMRRELRRRINILSGLVELADNEFSNVEKELASEPGFRSTHRSEKQRRNRLREARTGPRRSRFVPLWRICGPSQLGMVIRSHQALIQGAHRP